MEEKRLQRKAIPPRLPLDNLNNSLSNETKVERVNLCLEKHRRSLIHGYFAIALFLRFEMGDDYNFVDDPTIKFCRDHALILLEESQVWFDKLGEKLLEYKAGAEMEEELAKLRTEDPD